FTMAGSGMVKHHLTHKEPGWQRRLVINGFAGLVSFFVVLVLAVTKFTQGAFVVVFLFPLMMYALIRLNREYREESRILGEGAAERAVTSKALRRHVAFILVDRLDLATARAVQYARSMTLDDLRAVHFVIDTQRARYLQDRWSRLGMRDLPLELVECPDRRLVRAALDLAAQASRDGETEVTMLLPRRIYSRRWNRFLHDQTAERIGGALSRLPHVNATIVPFDVTNVLRQRGRKPAVGAKAKVGADVRSVEKKEDAKTFALVDGAVPIGSIKARQRVRIAGRIRSTIIQPWGSAPTLECLVADETGPVVVAFLGRRQVPGIEPGTRAVFEGTVSDRRGQMVLINPTYELLETQPA
ncbi:MAG TPA: OB-fold nucleic acid binding domain-containing protein, partial [Acidimicrobiales bacterium]|nr:OB-fold nucleic acid binding domain-containing protein [Acidimicrobiales bacterium]